MPTELIAYAVLGLASSLGSILWFFFKRLNNKMDKICEGLGQVQQSIIKLQEEQLISRDELFKLESRMDLLEIKMRKSEI